MLPIPNLSANVSPSANSEARGGVSNYSYDASFAVGSGASATGASGISWPMVALIALAAVAAIFFLRKK